MSHVIITGDGKGERQSNGLQRTPSRGQHAAGTGRTTNIRTGRYPVGGVKDNTGGVVQKPYSFDVSAGAIRVAQSMAEQDYFGVGEGDRTSAVEEEVLGAETVNREKSDGDGKSASQSSASGTQAGGVWKYADKNSAQLTPEEEAALAEAEQEEDKKDAFGYDEDTIEYMERLLESMRESREKNAKNQQNTKKRLNYNFRKVSGSIMRAKTVMQAGNALSSANSSLSSLRRKYASGKYNDKEMEAAVQHAKKMIRTARKKMNNLKREQQEQSLDDAVEGSKRLDNKKEQMAERNRSIANDVKREQELILLEKNLKRIREQKKNVRRKDEFNDLLNADLEYLKRQIQLMKQEQNQSSSSSYSYNGSSDSATAETAGAQTVPTQQTAAPSAAEVAGAAQTASGFSTVI